MMSTAPTRLKRDDEQPKERTYPYREKRQHGQQPGCQVAVGGERGETSGQVGADDARKDKDEPEEAKAVQSRDNAVRFDSAHRPELGQDVHARSKAATRHNLKRDVVGRCLPATFEPPVRVG